ncbi:hypothetical protein AAG906_003158 [Vitis piasezkii]
MNQRFDCTSICNCVLLLSLIDKLRSLCDIFPSLCILRASRLTNVLMAPRLQLQSGYPCCAWQASEFRCGLSLSLDDLLFKSSTSLSNLGFNAERSALGCQVSSTVAQVISRKHHCRLQYQPLTSLRKNLHYKAKWRPRRFGTNLHQPRELEDSFLDGNVEGGQPIHTSSISTHAHFGYTGQGTLRARTGCDGEVPSRWIPPMRLSYFGKTKKVS